MTNVYETDENLCELCSRTLPESYKENLCPICIESELFSEVRDYIRANVVNEYMVAERFDIPLSIVKGWIREGRIEYRDINQKNIVATHCQRCGKSVAFGSICSDCLKLLNTKSGVAIPKPDNVKMRFLNVKES